MDKIALLKREINYIKNDRYKENLKILINLLPDYFFEVAASSTGKYHPEFSLGEGGLLRHTKLVARIGFELYKDESITNVFNDSEKDLMMIGMILHDGLKHGLEKSEYVIFEHPIVMANFIRENSNLLTLNEKEIEFVASVIETHMGPWITDYKGNEVLEKPHNKYQKFVHMCDYLASRKFLNVNFLNNEILD